MLKRTIGAVLGLGLVFAAAGAQAAVPEMRVGAQSETKGGQNIVRVAGRAPLPDGAIVKINLYYGKTALQESRIFSKRVYMKGGALNGELVGDVRTFFPGDYLVRVVVDDSQPQNLGRLAPPLRRLTGEASVTVGDPLQVCDVVNLMSRRLVTVSVALHKIYPQLNTLLARAWNKKLQNVEWRAWKPRAELEKTREQLVILVCNRGGIGRVLPRSFAHALDLNTELVGMCQSIDDLLRGFVKDNDNLVKPKQGPLGQNPPVIMNLHGTMYQEGTAFYAATVKRLYDEVQSNYDQRRGRGAGGWDARASGWAQAVQKIDTLSSEYDGLGWITEKGDRPVRLKEVLLGVKEYAVACGRVLKGEADEATAELPRRRETIRVQLEGLMQ
jgi:hypothetical protein